MPASRESSAARSPDSRRSSPARFLRLSETSHLFRAVPPADPIPCPGIAVEALQPPGGVRTPCFVLADLAVLFVHGGSLKGEFGRTVHEFGMGGLAILPASTPMALAASDLDATIAYLNPDLLMSADGECPSHREIVPQFDPPDIQLPFLMACIRDEMQSGFPGGGQHLVALGRAIVTHLLARYSVARVSQPFVRGGLAPRQLRRAQDVMLATLDENIPLAGLALEAGLSRWHFCRAFRQSTGLSPRRWLRARRVERACVLLREEGRSLTSIALELGFSSPSHFSTAFKQSTGHSPQQYRRMQAI